MILVENRVNFSATKGKLMIPNNASSVTVLLGTLKQPVLTFHSDTERTELGGPVAMRWVSKTLNMLRDLQIESVAIELPTHWRTLMWHLALRLGGIIHTARSDAQAVVCADPDLAEDATWDADHVWLQGFARLGITYDGELPAGVGDAIAEVSTYPDSLSEPANSTPIPPLTFPGSRRILVCGGNCEELVDLILSAWMQRIHLVWAPDVTDLPVVPSELLIETPTSAQISTGKLVGRSMPIDESIKLPLQLQQLQDIENCDGLIVF